jgi:competence protein ComEC
MKSVLLIFLLVVSNILVFSSLRKEVKGVDSIYFFNVGQGDSELIRSGSVKLMIDTGPSKSIISSLEKILPRSDKYIDVLIISHPHADHYAGMDYLLENYEIGAVIWNGAESVKDFNSVLEKIKLKDIPTVKAFAGTAITSTNFDMRVIYPPRYTEEDILADNDGSLVMFAEVNGLAGLFTGDIAREAEAIISAVNFPEIDFLKVPHHGSNVSSSHAFLRAVNPAVAVLSVGKNNYGLPSEGALDRFNLLDIPVFRTDEVGGLLVRKEGETLKLESLE